MSAKDTVLMAPDEIRSICGGYVQPAKQLAILRERGFFRAWRSPVTGAVILERAHYHAVMLGQATPANEPKARPRVRA